MRSIDPALSLIGRRKDGTKFPIEFRSITIGNRHGPGRFHHRRRHDGTSGCAGGFEQQRDQHFRSVVEAVLDYAIYLLIQTVM